MKLVLDLLVDMPLIFDVLLKSTLLLLAAWTAHRALRSQNPRWRTVLWRGTATALLSMPLLTTITPGVELLVDVHSPKSISGDSGADPRSVESILPIEAERVSLEESLDGLHNETLYAEPDGFVEIEPALATQPANQLPAIEEGRAEVASLGIAHRFEWFLALAWAIGVTVLATRWLLAWLHIRQLVLTSRSAPQSMAGQCRQVAISLGCGGQIKVRLSKTTQSPLLVGVRRAIVVLPERMAGDEYRDALPGILAHELAHLQSRDLPWMLLVRFATTLFWIHPLTWRMQNVHAAACEEVSDAVAAQYVGDITQYSGILARVALEITGHVPAMVSLPMARHPETLSRLAFLRSGVQALPLGARRLVLVVALGGVAACALAGLRIVAAEETAAADEVGPETTGHNSIAADDDQKEAAATVRVLRFPKDRSLGTIYVMDRSVDLFPEIFDENDWYGETRPWKQLSPAQGSVAVPEGMRVKLLVSLSAFEDLSPLAQLGPDDIDVLMFGYPINESQLTDAQFKNIRGLTGLEELLIYKSTITGRSLRLFSRMTKLRKLTLVQSDRIQDTDLKRLSRLKSLEILQLGDAHVTGTGIGHLSQLDSLRVLALVVPNASGQGLDKIAQLPKLEQLDLIHSGGFGDEAIASLSAAPSLRVLRLIRQPITDKALEHLLQLENLQELTLAHASITDQGIHALKKMTSLRKLDLQYTKVTGAACAHLATLEKLESLDLPGETITDAVLEHLAKLSNLKELTISRTAENDVDCYTDEGIRLLSKLDKLEKLHLGGPGVSDTGMAHIAKLTRLRDLNTFGCPISDTGMAELRKLKNLEQLGVNLANITVSGLNHLNELQKLTHLTVGDVRQDHARLDFSSLPRLETLMIFQAQGSAITDADLGGLTELKHLRWLQIIGVAKPRISDAGLAHLAGLTSLERLTIGGPNMTDEGLAKLSDLKQLKVLRLRGQFTDAGLRHLEELKALSHLTISSSNNLSEPAKQRLRKKLTGLFSFTADSDRSIGQSSKIPLVGDRAPDFKATTLDGKEIALKDYRGKAVLIYFWGTWCSPCVASLPGLKQLHDELADEHGKQFAMLNLAMDDEKAQLSDVIEKYKLTWPQVRIGTHSKTAAEYGVIGAPHYFVIGPDGIIASTSENWNEIRAAVARSLGKKIKPASVR